ncbi:WD40 repeat domain-containing protein [Fuerstiella marisgermanici]|uniref:PQQ-dependent catabolism-associated beta-propeller protein n=1 Tax=Fuerstiella marisgermanici TaxID=1891926 RepID=A0A1P8WES2_9PLAN|nr:WD40 repeat domain-containing protein [Fuerstiella marisgermanici]APZ92576.1 PQQ-dependent catabolism-associated beta-propeller protein [Fuerstiella marisgermanici]
MVLNSQRFTIVVWLVLGSSVSAQTVQDEHPKRVDIQGDPLPEGVAVRCGTVRYRHPGWYKQVDFLPGTHHFVVSPKGYSPIIWDAVSGKMVSRFDHRGHVACVRVVPGSGNVVMLTLDINNETRMCRAWFTMPHDGGGRQLRWKEPFTEHSVKFALSPDAHILAVGTYHGMLTFRNLETGKERNSELVIDGEVSWIDWSPGGDRIAVAGRGGAAILKWDSAKQEVEILTRIKRAQVVRFSNDGSLLAVGSERKSGPAVIWDATTGAMIRQVGNVDANYYREGLCFSSDDSVLYVPNNYGKQVEAFDVKTGELQRSFPVPRTPPRAVAISDDGRFLVSVGSESQIAVWDLTTGELISDRFPGHAERAGDLTFMPDGKKLVSGDSRGVIRVWNSYTGTQLHKFEHDHWVAGLGVSPTGDQIVSVGLDETVRTWELNPPREVLRSEGHGRLGSNDICAAAYTLISPRCTQVLSRSSKTIWRMTLHAVRCVDLKRKRTHTVVKTSAAI